MTGKCRSPGSTLTYSSPDSDPTNPPGLCWARQLWQGLSAVKKGCHSIKQNGTKCQLPLLPYHSCIGSKHCISSCLFHLKFKLSIIFAAAILVFIMTSTMMMMIMMILIIEASALGGKTSSPYGKVR